LTQIDERSIPYGKVTLRSLDPTAKVWETVWDARTGAELKGEPFPPSLPNDRISPDGRFFARLKGDRVELTPLTPDEEERAYRLLHTQPNLQRYREGFESARAARDDLAAQFYLKLLPPPERAALGARMARERGRLDEAIALYRKAVKFDPKNRDLHITLGDVLVDSGRTGEAVACYLKATELDPRDVCLKAGALQAWWRQEKEFATTRTRLLSSVKGTRVAVTAEQAVRMCNIQPYADKAELEAVLVLARTAVEVGKGGDWNLLGLGVAEFRNGNDAAAEKTLLAAEQAGPSNAHGAGTSQFFRAMILFRQGKKAEAGKLASEATARLKPLPRDEKNPLADGAHFEDLILWLAYKEAKALIKFDAAPASPATPKEK
jgi:tetratricopeptide (TPR) repeat protein